MDNSSLPYVARCIECGKEFTGRPDKKFCSRQCKNTYNNRRTSRISRYRRSTINALDRNYEILSHVLAIGATSARTEDLCNLGFRPETVTSHKKGENGHNEYSCYDIVYHQTGMKVFNLHRMEASREISPSVPHDRR